MFDSIPTLWHIALVLLTLGWLSNRLLVSKPLPNIPYNRYAVWMPWGDLASLGIHSLFTGSTFDWLSRQCIKRKSPIVQILIPSFSTTKPAVLIADLPEIKNIIVNRVREIDRASLIHYWFEVAVPLATTGQKTTSSFKRQRRVWNCMINPEFLQDVATPVFEKTIERLVELWTIKVEMAETSPFMAYEDLRRTTLDGIWKLITGLELGLGDASISQLETKRLHGQNDSVFTGKAPSSSFPYFFDDFIMMATGMDWVVQGISPRIYKWIFNRLPPFVNSMGRTKTMLGGFITEIRGRVHNQLPLQRCGLSDVLQQKENAVSDASMIDEIVELFITGHETTATTTAWGLKYLAEHQEIQQRLYNHLRQAFPNATSSSLPPASDITRANIPYLDAALAEILRIGGTGPVLFRETVFDCEIMGHQIQAGTPLLLITQSPPGPDMITPDTFKAERVIPAKQQPINAERWGDEFREFIPERWLDNEGNFDPDAGLSLPFATGKRGCFGKRIAMLELKLLVVMLVLSFRFEKLPKRLSKFNSKDGLTRQPASCYVKPVLRDT